MTHKKKKLPFDSPLPLSLAANPAVSALSYAYAAAIGARNFVYDGMPALSRRLPRPVVSIGGIRAGGVGKTPIAQLVGRHLIDKCQCSVAFLSRGYGRKSAKRTIIVNPDEVPDWEDVGDEPWMLHRNIRESWLGIGADRARAAAILAPLLPERAVFVFDDGFQHRRARRDLNIVCLGESTFADRLLPAGYLREPVSALSRADVVLAVGALGRADRLSELKAAVDSRFGKERGGDTGGNRSRAGGDTNARAAPQKPESAPITAILLQYPLHWVEARTGKIAKKIPLKSPIAVTGIAEPQRFLDMLASQSVTPATVRIHKDHHKFKFYDIDPNHNIYLNGVVTTEKDAVRLLSPEFAPIPEIWYLKIGLRFADHRSEALVLSKISSIVP